MQPLALAIALSVFSAAQASPAGSGVTEGIAKRQSGWTDPCGTDYSSPSYSSCWAGMWGKRDVESADGLSKRQGGWTDPCGTDYASPEYSSCWAGMWGKRDVESADGLSKRQGGWTNPCGTDYSSPSYSACWAGMYQRDVEARAADTDVEKREANGNYGGWTNPCGTDYSSPAYSGCWSGQYNRGNQYSKQAGAVANKHRGYKQWKNPCGNDYSSTSYSKCWSNYKRDLDEGSSSPEGGMEKRQWGWTNPCGTDYSSPSYSACWAGQWKREADAEVKNSEAKRSEKYDDNNDDDKDKDNESYEHKQPVAQANTYKPQPARYGGYHAKPRQYKQHLIHAVQSYGGQTKVPKHIIIKKIQTYQPKPQGYYSNNGGSYQGDLLGIVASAGVHLNLGAHIGVGGSVGGAFGAGVSGGAHAGFGF